MIRKSSCTSVHCGFRIFANLEIPPFGLASLSHAPPCRVVSCHPGIAALHASHCLVYPAVLFYPSCPGCNCQKPHLSSIFHPILPYSPHPSHPFYSILFHSILFYPILSYPIPPIYPPARLAQVHLASFPGISVSGVPSGHPTWHSFRD